MYWLYPAIVTDETFSQMHLTLVIAWLDFLAGAEVLQSLPCVSHLHTHAGCFSTIEAGLSSPLPVWSVVASLLVKVAFAMFFINGPSLSDYYC